jgi:hypothetical protein
LLIDRIYIDKIIELALKLDINLLKKKNAIF